MNTLKKHKKQIAEFCKKNDIVLLGVFGSYARGDQTEDSDIDLVFRWRNKTGKSYFDLFDLQYALEEILGKKVELFTEVEIGRRIAPMVQKYLKFIYKEPDYEL